MKPSGTLKELLVGIKKDEKIFAKDIDTKGKKFFLRGNRQQYITQYNKELKRGATHWYEILLEDRPCPVVLDIESKNKQYIKTREAIEELMKVFNIAVESKTGQSDEYMYLDSSSADKVSFHIIGTVMFKNLAHVGALVRSVWSGLQTLRSNNLELPEGISMQSIEYLYEADGTWIVDDCIYTRNRFFRLPLSSKKGSKRVLKPLYPPGKKTNGWTEMLVQRPHGGPVYECLEMCGSDPIYTSMPADRCMKCVDGQWMLMEKKRTQHQTVCTAVHPYVEPVIDKLNAMGYMLKNDLKFNSARRSWCVNTYSKQCGIAKREHASNHIWFEIDGLGGRVIQRCYDSNCAGGVDVDVEDAWDEWTLAWSTMVDVSDLLTSLDRGLLITS
jgi:hypothetical protein